MLVYEKSPEMFKRSCSSISGDSIACIIKQTRLKNSSKVTRALPNFSIVPKITVLAGLSWLVCQTSRLCNLIRHVPPSNRELQRDKKSNIFPVPFPSSRLPFISDWTCLVMLDNKIERFSSSVAFFSVDSGSSLGCGRTWARNYYSSICIDVTNEGRKACLSIVPLMRQCVFGPSSTH